jgi:hypothetical protein
MGEGGILSWFSSAFESVLEDGGLVDSGDGEATELVEDDWQEGADVADAVDSALVTTRLHELLSKHSGTWVSSAVPPAPQRRRAVRP